MAHVLYVQMSMQMWSKYFTEFNFKSMSIKNGLHKNNRVTRNPVTVTIVSGLSEMTHVMDWTLMDII